MFPVLFSIGNNSISSFGVFLGLAFIFGVFLVWRLSRAWDLEEEKILDLTLLAFVFGLIGARLYFVVENLAIFVANPINIILANKYPGFSFWGAFLGGWLTLYYFSRRKKMDFWQVVDLASVGFLGGLIFSSLGCFLGGCSVGVVSQFLSVPMVGQVGQRFPVQLIEAILFAIALKNIWHQATHFHFRGKIVILALIYIGVIKLLTESLREDHSGGYIFSVTIIILGVTIFYKLQAGKRTPVSDLKTLIHLWLGFITDGRVRKTMIDHLKKYWYNQKVAIFWQLKNITKTLRRFRVKFSHKESKLY